MLPGYLFCMDLGHHYTLWSNQKDTQHLTLHGSWNAEKKVLQQYEIALLYVSPFSPNQPPPVLSLYLPNTPCFLSLCPNACSHLPPSPPSPPHHPQSDLPYVSLLSILSYLSIFRFLLLKRFRKISCKISTKT